MSKPKPPKPANDHLAAFGGHDDGLDALTNEELEARVQATAVDLGRQIKLRILRLRAQNLTSMNARKWED